MIPAVLVFDLDGVIVKSNFTKHETMLSLFADRPDLRETISAFILAHGGVPRRDKLAHILKHCLHVEPTDAVLGHYLAQYAVRLEQLLAVAPFVEGAVDFIAAHQGDRYVCSSAPEAEVHQQLIRGSLHTCFSAIYGGTTPKHQALRDIAAKHQHQPVCFFGDSVGDHEAACQAKVGFVGVVCERDNFDGLPVVKLKDFSSPLAIAQAVRQSAGQAAGSRFEPSHRSR